MPSRVQGPDKLHALTSVRFFAAAYVVLFHTAGMGWRDAPACVKLFLSYGYVSVSFFFFLSGYILAVVYLGGSRELVKREFAVARFARIYPLFLLTIIADLPHLLGLRIAHYGVRVAVTKTLATFIGHLLMLQAWTPKLQYALNEPAWSLSAETFLYLCFPLAGVLLWRLNRMQLLLVSVALYVAGQGAVWLVTPHFVAESIYSFPLLHLSTFLLGILLAKWRATYDAASFAPPSQPTLYVALTIAVSLFCAFIVFGSRLPTTNLRDGLLVPIFALTVWALSYPNFKVSQALSGKWLVLLGEASFALYLIHVVIMHLYEMAGVKPAGLAFVLYLLVCVGLSVLSCIRFEAPARKVVLRYFHSKTRETFEAASDA
jgi:peptidoglycan/LPS O-acetylase OafA/YrhL